jgi:hypothetical protein
LTQSSRLQSKDDAISEIFHQQQEEMESFIRNHNIDLSSDDVVQLMQSIELDIEKEYQEHLRSQQQHHQRQRSMSEDVMMDEGETNFAYDGYDDVDVFSGLDEFNANTPVLCPLCQRRNLNEQAGEFWCGCGAVIIKQVRGYVSWFCAHLIIISFSSPSLLPLSLSLCSSLE